MLVDGYGEAEGLGRPVEAHGGFVQQGAGGSLHGQRLRVAGAVDADVVIGQCEAGAQCALLAEGAGGVGVVHLQLTAHDSRRAAAS